jgi:hypothetical protein
MAATNGTFIFTGLRTRKSYIVDVYLDDVADALMNWDGGAGATATSPEEWRPPEPVVLTDVAIVTGAAQTKLQLTRNNQPTGDMLRQTMHLNTLAFRPRLAIGFGQGSIVRAIQKA